MKIAIPLFTNLFFIFIILSASLCAGALFFISHRCIITFSHLADYSSRQPSIVLDDEGNEWARFQCDRREIPDDMPLPVHVIHAFIAAEDWSFFSHNGISWKGIVRSTLVNLYHGRRAQGASTITQQLVKLLFFDSKKTFTRKIKEQIYALLVEQQFTKEQILLTYLNNVCFGCGIYGIEAASQRFWSKHAHELSLDEAATLAGIIRSPAHYCPLVYPLSAQQRRTIVLKKMLHLGFITENEYQQATEKNIQLRETHAHCCAPHAKEMIRLFVEDSAGKSALYTSGLCIKTTINKAVQGAAQVAFTTTIAALRTEFNADIDGGMIVLDRKTGEIKALVGGFNFEQSKWNRVTQARRQIGSTIKPLLYAVAAQDGISCADTDIDEPIELVHNKTVWKPKNYNKKYVGQITLAYALSHSINTISVKTLLRINPQDLVDVAKKCGMKGDFHTYPSLALGCVDGTLHEIAGMFNIFANDGIYQEPHIISLVKDRWGGRMYKAQENQERVLPSHTVGHIASVLRLAPERLKLLYGARNWIDTEAISKTGTTNDSRTCWYVGSTPQYTTAVYVGFDDNRPMGDNIYPIKTAFPIWLAFNRAVEQPEKHFSYDPSLQSITINEFTGCACDLNDCHALSLLV